MVDNHTFLEYQLCPSYHVHQSVILQVIAQDWVLYLHWLTDHWENCTLQHFCWSQVCLFRTVHHHVSIYMGSSRLSFIIARFIYFDHCLTLHTGHGNYYNNYHTFLDTTKQTMARYNTFFDTKFVFLNVHHHIDLHETIPYWNVLQYFTPSYFLRQVWD